jgi:hypothetical protein
VGPQRYVEARVKRRLYSFKKVSIASLVEERREKKTSVLDIISDNQFYGDNRASEVCKGRADKRLY